MSSLNLTADVEPWTYFEEVRRGGEVVWDEQMNAWLDNGIRADLHVSVRSENVGVR